MSNKSTQEIQVTLKQNQEINTKKNKEIPKASHFQTKNNEKQRENLLGRLAFHLRWPGLGGAGTPARHDHAAAHVSRVWRHDSSEVFH